MNHANAALELADARVQCTPISDLIRECRRARIIVEAPFAVPANAAVGGIETGWAAGLTLLLQDLSTLPPFEESQLDDPQLLSSAAAEIYRMRRARDQHMPDGLMGEPAWDILLALYAEEPAKLPVSSVCYGCGMPQTTALRWVGVLESGGLVERTQHPRDTRITLLSLSATGRLTVERSLKAMLRASRA